jgi:hypothetical protein
MQKPEEMHIDRRYTGPSQNRTKVGHPMKLAACISIALAISGLPSALAAAEQCRFIEARSEREACYQRQETARATRQKANEAREAEQQKPYEPMTQEDAQLAKSMRGICRGC